MLVNQARIDMADLNSKGQDLRTISLDNIVRLAKALGLKLHEMMPDEDLTTD